MNSKTIYRTQDFLTKLQDQITAQNERVERAKDLLCESIELQLRKLSRHADGTVLILDQSTASFGIITLDDGRPNYQRPYYDHGHCDDERIDCGDLVRHLQEDAIELVIKFQPLLEKFARVQNILKDIDSVLPEANQDDYESSDTEESMRSQIQRARESERDAEARYQAELAEEAEYEATMRDD